MSPDAWVSWSCGKDSAFALHELDDAHRVTGLLTTTSAAHVPVHGVPRELVQAQADALGLPLHVVELPWPCPNAEYERRTGAAVEAAVRSGVRTLVYGDLFLADIREYRERALAGSGLTPHFPLWERPTAPLASRMVEAGIRAVVVAVDPARMPAELAGRPFDAEFLRDLPADVDPCGERGEYHTFVTDSPGFAVPVEVEVTGTAEQDGMVVASLQRS